MLRRLRDTAIAALFGAFVLAFGIAVWSASSCQSPQKSEKTTTQTNPDEKTCKAFDVASFRFLGTIFKDNPTEIAAVVTALATVFIAWFTLTLRRSTDKLWDAAKAQSTHFVS